MSTVHVVLEPSALALQPRPSDHLAVLGPDTDPPFALTLLVRTQVPGEVTDVPLRARPEQRPLLQSKALHSAHNLRIQAHRPARLTHVVR